MNRILNVKLENCFGIGKLEKEFKFTPKERAQLIYAPNGTMKSSFANVFEYLSKDQRSEIKDRIFSENIALCQINFDGESLNRDNILVVNAETKLSENSITNFIAKEELKSRYDEIFIELLNEKSKFITVLRKQSRAQIVKVSCKLYSTKMKTFSNIYCELKMKYQRIYLSILLNIMIFLIKVVKSKHF